MIPDTDLHLVKRMRLFDRLPPDEVAEITQGATVRSIPKGGMLFQQGYEANYFYGVLSGWIKVYKTAPSGEQAVLGIFGRGETFAEAAMFIGRRYPASAEAIENSRLCLFERRAFEASIESNPRLCLGMLGSISYHLHHMVLQVEQLKTRNAQQRLAHFLLGLADRDEGSAEIILPYDKALVAARLGMTPESLSRNIVKLSQYGVRVDSNVVTVTDIERLSEQCLHAMPPRRASAAS